MFSSQLINSVEKLCFSVDMRCEIELIDCAMGAIDIQSCQQKFREQVSLVRFEAISHEFNVEQLSVFYVC